jgi:thiol:disulfide interchange protein DsbA
MRLRACFLGWLALTLIALPAAAQQGSGYRVIAQQPVESGERVEVIDFFFYACPYCNDLRPRLETWRQRKPADVVFRRIPVVRHDSWVPLAKTYYALEALGEAERLHAAVFRGYHVEELSMSQEKVIAEWAEKHGLDREKFMAAYRSDDVRQKVEKARKMTMDYDIQGTPAMVVDGKYIAEGFSPRSIDILDGMIRLARQQRAANSAK